MHSGGTVDGFEARTGKFLWYAYYGGIYIRRERPDRHQRKPVGYGYSRFLQQPEQGHSGAYFRLQRDHVGQPALRRHQPDGPVRISDRDPGTSARARRTPTTTRIYFDIRYTLPGSMPNVLNACDLNRGRHDAVPTNKGDSIYEETGYFWITLLAAAACDGGLRCRNHQRGGRHFPAAIYQKWFEEFHKAHPDIQINYQSIGSGGGIRQLTEGTVDFGASDMPMTDEQISKITKYQSAAFPDRARRPRSHLQHSRRSASI